MHSKSSSVQDLGADDKEDTSNEADDDLDDERNINDLRINSKTLNCKPSKIYYKQRSNGKKVWYKI